MKATEMFELSLQNNEQLRNEHLARKQKLQRFERYKSLKSKAYHEMSEQDPLWHETIEKIKKASLQGKTEFVIPFVENKGWEQENNYEEEAERFGRLDKLIYLLDINLYNISCEKNGYIVRWDQW